MNNNKKTMVLSIQQLENMIQEVKKQNKRIYGKRIPKRANGVFYFDRNCESTPKTLWCNECPSVSISEKVF